MAHESRDTVLERIDNEYGGCRVSEWHDEGIKLTITKKEVTHSVVFISQLANSGYVVSSFGKRGDIMYVYFDPIENVLNREWK